MKKLLSILIFSVAMAFAQESFEFGPMVGLGFAHSFGEGTDAFYGDIRNVGLNVKTGMNFLLSPNSSVAFHIAFDIAYQEFDEPHSEDSYSSWYSFWEVDLHIPVVLRTYWGYFYLEAGLRPTIVLSSGWDYNVEDDVEDSGSLDDAYKRFRLGMLSAIGMKLRPADFSIFIANDFTSAIKNRGNGQMKNLEVGFNFGFYFGGKRKADL